MPAAGEMEVLAEDHYEQDGASMESKEEETVKVCLRLRPCTKPGGRIPFKIKDNVLIARCPGETQSNASQKHYTFTNVFEDNVSQAEVFDCSIRPTIRPTLGEPGATFLTYGTSGSGKTYTLLGNETNPGIVPRSIEQIYEELYDNISTEPSLKMECMKPIPLSDESVLDELRKLNLIKSRLQGGEESRMVISDTIQSQHQFEPLNMGDRRVFIWISFVEIYNENVYDLLNIDGDFGKRKPMKVLSNDGNAYIKGLSTLYAGTKEDAYDLLQYGLQSATYGATDVNSNSSRSHSIFTITVITHSVSTQRISQSVYKFCDLAGSERLKKTGTMGDRLKEAQKINTSLLVLGRCLETVHKNQKTKKIHDLVPVRDSKLTMIIQSALLGKEPMTMIVNVYPTEEFHDENLNVLNFSSIAKQIVISKEPKIMKAPSSTRYSFFLSQAISSPSSKVDTHRLLMEYESLKLENERLAAEAVQMKGDIVCLQRKLAIQEFQLRNELTDNFQQHFAKMEESSELRIESAKELATMPFKQKLSALEKKLKSKEQIIMELEDEQDDYERKLKAYEEELSKYRLQQTLHDARCLLREDGEELKMRDRDVCTTAGRPRKRRQWVALLSTVAYVTVGFVLLAFLTTPSPVSAVSTSAASLRHSGGGGVKDTFGWDDAGDEEEGYCAPYNGKVCKRFINSRQVWYSREDGTGGWENEKITTALFDDLINDLPSSCRPAAEKLLCAYAFPQCVIKDGTTIRLPLCYEDCVATYLQFCYNDWALIEEKKERGDVIKTRGHFRLPNCEELPRYNKTAKPPVCSHVGLTELVSEEVTYDCRMGNGRFYLGTVNVTSTGIPCQKWDSQEPHSHHKPPLVFAELQDAENYCRNAGGEEPTPWCYTTDKTVRWQACDIPLCPNSTDASDIRGKIDMTMESVFTPSMIFLLSGIGLVAIVLLHLMVLLCYRVSRHRRNRRQSGAAGYNTNATSQDGQGIDINKLPSNVNYHRTGAQLNPKLEKLEFPRNNIIYIKDLGQGAFGRVFQAKAPGLVAGEDFTLVAVKMLKDEASQDLQVDFEREACLLAEFDHPNIVKLLGVCAIGRPMCLLFEFMARGDLNEFLRQCSPFAQQNRADSISTELSHGDLLNIAHQIASGMVYLSERKFVHRDLATRNCLIDDHMVVKIADFGLSHKIYLQDYYKGDENDAIPIRWMPLESILYNKYTIESDVWAYGVCLWEIFSFAMQPYYGMTHEEVVKFVKEGNMLGCPENTPLTVYDLMRKCWSRKPNDRPSFHVIYQKLQQIRADFDGKMLM
uniref:receptor protein-tyrosine kinase n=1 Tax=Anopheles christyi TaxID=43041 RepID=A0A182JSW9_9DIPT